MKIKMPGTCFILEFLLVAVVLRVRGDDELFGMRLTTERLKTRENSQYLFRYFVKDDMTGDYKIQEEAREGDSVRGSYTLAEPNGDLRTVTYKASPGTGFEAKVDVQPSASPMKPLSEATATLSDFTTEKPALESKVKNIPGGFVMDILSKPPSEVKTEMGMKFSINTESVPASTTGVKATEGPETTPEMVPQSPTTVPPVENATVPTEGRDMSEDPIEKEIDDALNSMPKLPELVLADNKTHLKFQKDPEEALLDERITQIARQLAETSLRREYEERKLGHFLPISVRPIEHSTLGYFSKSFKFANDDLPNFRPRELSPLQLLTQFRLLPDYVPDIPKFSSVYHRLPVVTRPRPEGASQEKFTTDPAFVPSENQLRNKLLKLKRKEFGSAADRELIPVMPVRVPTFLQFFSPFQRYVVQPQTKPRFYVGPLNENLATGSVPVTDDATFYMVNERNGEKS